LLTALIFIAVSLFSRVGLRSSIVVPLRVDSMALAGI
jgi:hypothetical protein